MMIKIDDRAEQSNGHSSVERHLTCEEFQASMPQLIGGNIRSHQHLKTCERCEALVTELEYIASIAGDLLSPDEHEPRSSVWDNISASLSQTDEKNSNRQGHS